MVNSVSSYNLVSIHIPQTMIYTLTPLFPTYLPSFTPPPLLLKRMLQEHVTQRGRQKVSLCILIESLPNGVLVCIVLVSVV